MDVSRCNHDSDDEEDASTNDEDGDQHFWNEHSEAMQECANALYIFSPTIQTIQTKNRSYEQSLWNSDSVWLDRPSRLQVVSTTNQCKHDCHTHDDICRTQQTMGENSAQDPKRAHETWMRTGSEGSGGWSGCCYITGATDSAKTNTPMWPAYHHPVRRCLSYLGNTCEKAVRASQSPPTSAAYWRD